jgi:hypothetical protein
MARMINFIKDIGLNAGKIWNLLSDKGPMVPDQIIRNTGLKKKELNAVIGWLARENKIRREGDVLVIGETNLTNQIGINAGNIMQFIEDSGNFFSAVGWLAREGKITEENFTRLDNIRRTESDFNRSNMIIEELVSELEIRNNLIEKLSNQLQEKHIDVMQNCENIGNLRSEIFRHQKNSKIQTEMLDRKEKNIVTLKMELENKNLEIDKLQNQLKYGNHILKMENDELKTILRKMPIVHNEDNSNNITDPLCDEDHLVSHLKTKKSTD